MGTRAYGKFVTALHVSMDGCKSAISIDFRVTNKFYPVGNFTNTESANK